MAERDLVGPDDPMPPRVELAADVLTVFRSRRTRACEGCGGEIAAGQDYIRRGLGAFHRDCLPETRQD